MGSDSEFYNLSWNEFQSSVANSFMDLRNKDEFLDVTLAIDEDHQYQAHKVILSASSPYFRAVLKKNPAQHPVLVMPPNVRYSDLIALLDFIYQGEVKIHQTELQEFLSLAGLLKIKGLTEDQKPAEQKPSEIKNKPIIPQGVKMSPGVARPQMVQKRGPQGQPPQEGSQVKRNRKNNEPPEPPMHMPQERQGSENEDLDKEGMVHDIIDEGEGNETYDEYGDQYESGQNYPMTSQQQQPQSPQLRGLVCPQCQVLCQGVEGLKSHMAQAHGGTVGRSATKPARQKVSEEDKKFLCHICDKPFKTMQYVRNHIKRLHKLDNPAEVLQGEDPEGMMMDPPGMMHPVKKKGRPTKKMEHLSEGVRPIGQVPPAPRSGMEGMDMHEPPRPPVQQERASPMVQRSGGMRPIPGGRGRPMMAQQGFNFGPGMRPRGPGPQHFSKAPQAQPRHGNVDMKRLGMKLGGAISISSSDSDRENPTASSSQRPIPGPSRMHVSSPRPRMSSLPQESAVEVKQEPMDDMYEEGEEGEEIPEDYDEDFGEEEEEEGYYDDMEGIYPGEAPYDEDVENDDGVYQQ